MRFRLLTLASMCVHRMYMHKRDERLIIRVSKDETDMLKDLADDDGGSMSEWIRRAIRRAYTALQRRKRANISTPNGS